MMNCIETLKNRLLAGGEISQEEALQLASCEDKEQLYQAASEITAQLGSNRFSLCSIINAKSGRCSENCKWCAQSAHYKTQIEEYDLVDSATCVKWAKHNEAQGVSRYSLVTSGRKLTAKQLESVSATYREIAAESSIQLCASMGLLTQEELQQLKEAGVSRYHCNLECAPSYFPNLCTTHTIEQKMETIRAAQAIGMSICSGGIIGMGESMAQRIELAVTLRDLGVDSIPVNVLQPIAGTPLEESAPLTDEEFLTSLALFRFIHPRTKLRFAGGRAQFSPEVIKRAMKIAVNAAIVGDMLTTVGSRISDDKALITSIGYTL